MSELEDDRAEGWGIDAEPPEDFSGFWVRHDPSGGRREIEYRDGAPHGLVREWDRDDRLLLEGQVENGLWHGPLNRWGVNGQLLDISHFTHGTGIYRIFTSDGRLAQEIELVDGRRHGVTKRWNGRGELAGPPEPE